MVKKEDEELEALKILKRISFTIGGIICFIILSSGYHRNNIETMLFAIGIFLFGILNK